MKTEREKRNLEFIKGQNKQARERVIQKIDALVVELHRQRIRVLENRTGYSTISTQWVFGCLSDLVDEKNNLTLYSSLETVLSAND